MTIEVVYTTESTATGGGRDGHVKSADGRIDLDTRPPKAMGGNGEGTNPEQLFSAGYAVCFLGALRLVAGKSKVKLDDATNVTVEIGFGKDSAGGFGLTGKIVGDPPGAEKNVAAALAGEAPQGSPHTQATPPHPP